ncbi:hypothetical protein J120_03945 [candidate division TM6 bacterium JCVI TM6SC1]|uniref:Uncharacterized protein n=1 Tax=candidate division TM6 bacterium JCVI TM6SC1 TaxID=1306947 RepID=A0A0D2JDK2_9BACT|nr:hypothetical protein J120_03945 [candidate division TM6 bacterium JCVI TM6SC1]
MFKFESTKEQQSGSYRLVFIGSFILFLMCIGSGIINIYAYLTAQPYQVYPIIKLLIYLKAVILSGYILYKNKKISIL